MFQTIFHRGIRAGKADFHHSLPIQIAVRVFDLLDKITQPLFSWSRRVKPDAAALDKLACMLNVANRFVFVPAYLQLAPLPEELYSSGNAVDYQR